MSRKKKQYTSVCCICGKSVTSASANKRYCDECFREHRALQSALLYQRTKARKEYEKIMALSSKKTNEQKETIGLSADYIDSAERKLCEWAGISYGYFVQWKMRNGIAYLEWLVRLRECYKKRDPSEKNKVVLPSIPPAGLKQASPPQPHIWGGEVHKIWDN